MIRCFAVDNSFQITANGSIQPCCKFRKPHGRLNDYSSIEEIMQDPFLDELRQHHSKGDWTANCARCEHDESTGGRSRRMYYERQGLEPGKDFFLDISLGTHCNLKCRMCGPENSTQWHSDYRHLHGLGLVGEKDLTVFMMSDEQIAQIASFIETRTGRVLIEVKGGEPFLSPQAELFFRSLAQCKNAQQIELIMTSNLTRIPSWWAEVSKPFRDIQFNISIDGIDEVYDYIRGERAGGSDLILHHAQQLQTYSNHNIRFNVVVQNLNVLQLGALYDKLMSIVNDPGAITLITLFSPQYYVVNVLPKPLREQAIQQITQSRVREHTGCQQILNLLNTEPDPKLWDKFERISKELDKLRNQDLCSLIKVT